MGIVNTSPDQDFVELWSGPDATGEMLRALSAGRLEGAVRLDPLRLERQAGLAHTWLALDENDPTGAGQHPLQRVDQESPLVVTTYEGRVGAALQETRSLVVDQRPDAGASLTQNAIHNTIETLIVNSAESAGRQVTAPGSITLTAEDDATIKIILVNQKKYSLGEDFCRVY